MLVHMAEVDGNKFLFALGNVNFVTETVKMCFTLMMYASFASRSTSLASQSSEERKIITECSRSLKVFLGSTLNCGEA